MQIPTDTLVGLLKAPATHLNVFYGLLTAAIVGVAVAMNRSIVKLLKWMWSRYRVWYFSSSTPRRIKRIKKIREFALHIRRIELDESYKEYALRMSELLSVLAMVYTLFLLAVVSMIPWESVPYWFQLFFIGLFGVSANVWLWLWRIRHKLFMAARRRLRLEQHQRRMTIRSQRKTQLPSISSDTVS